VGWHTQAGHGPAWAVALPGSVASTISAQLRGCCQVRSHSHAACRAGPGSIACHVRLAADGVTGQSSLQPAGLPHETPAADGEDGLAEVTFSPAEPQLTPGAARAVLAMLLRARDKARPAQGGRT
jgi:hypothetical protein